VCAPVTLALHGLIAPAGQTVPITLGTATAGYEASSRSGHRDRLNLNLATLTCRETLHRGRVLVQR
jgi:hypothetical protein